MEREKERCTVDWIPFSHSCKFRVTSLKTHIHPVFSEWIFYPNIYSFPKERHCVPISTSCDGHFDM